MVCEVRDCPFIRSWKTAIELWVPLTNKFLLLLLIVTTTITTTVTVHSLLLIVSRALHANIKKREVEIIEEGSIDLGPYTVLNALYEGR